jgi:hypothetical protein
LPPATYDWIYLGGQPSAGKCAAIAHQAKVSDNGKLVANLRQSAPLPFITRIASGPFSRLW